MKLTDRLVGIRLVFEWARDVYRIDHIYKRAVNGIDIEIVAQLGMTMPKHASASTIRTALEDAYLPLLGDIWEKNSPKDMTWLFVVGNQLSTDEFGNPGDLWVLYAKR